MRPTPGSVPAFVMVPDVLIENVHLTPGQFAGWLGGRYEAFRLQGDPSRPDFSVPALARLLHDQDYDVNIAAAAALDRFGPAARGAVPDLIKALAGRAGCYVNGGGNGPAAVHDYSQAISLSPNASALYLRRAAADRVAGDTDAAVADYQHAADIPSASSDQLQIARQTLERALTELQGVRLNHGLLKSATIVETTDGQDYKVVFVKGASRDAAEKARADQALVNERPIAAKQAHRVHDGHHGGGAGAAR